MTEKKSLTWAHYVAVGAGVSATLAGLVAGGYFLGSYMDRAFDSYPLWTPVGVFVALLLGLTNMVFLFWKIMKAEDSSEPEDKADGFKTDEVPKDEP